MEEDHTLAYEERVTLAEEFYTSESTGYYPKLLDALRTNTNLNIDFKDLTEFNDELAQALLEEPLVTIEAFKQAQEHHNLGNTRNIDLEFSNLTESATLSVDDIQVEHEGKFLSVKGSVSGVGPLIGLITSITYECYSCSKIITVQGVQYKIRKPALCPSCKVKINLRIIKKNKVNCKVLVLETPSDQLKGNLTSRRFSILIVGKYAEPRYDEYFEPGKELKVNGIIECKHEHNDETNPKMIITMTANNIELVERLEEKEPTEQEKKIIIQLAQEPDILEKLALSIAPDIEGYLNLKKAITLQIFGSPESYNRRKAFHIMICSDPGMGKSVFSKDVLKMALKGEYTSATSASGGGLTAIPEKDELLGRWVGKPGALVRAHKGICVIDEFTRLPEPEQDKLYQVLANEEVTLVKAGLKLPYKASTSVIALCNPEGGRFSRYETFISQLNVKAPLFDRFDLVFVMRDKVDPEEDLKVMRAIQRAYNRKDNEDVDKNRPITRELFKKYVWYAKKIEPYESPEALLLQQQKFRLLRDLGKEPEAGKLDKKESEEFDADKVPVSKRHAEAIMRLSRCVARVHLHSEVTKEDVEEAYQIMNECIQQLIQTDEGGEKDLSGLSARGTPNKKEYKRMIQRIIEHLSSQDPDKRFIAEDAWREAQKKAIPGEDFEEILEMLNKFGDIIIYRPGVYTNNMEKK